MLNFAPIKLSFYIASFIASWTFLDALPQIDHTFVVTKSTDSGQEGELRWAIKQSNLNPPSESKINLISFQLKGSGPFRITPKGDLTPITQPVIVDGFSQQGAIANSRLLIEISGTENRNSNGLVLKGIGGQGAVIRGLVIGGFSQSGIVLDNSLRCSIEGNLIGIDTYGTSAHPNQFGIKIINGSSQCDIGASDLSSRNVIAGSYGSGAGIWIADSSHINMRGNLIGTDISGTKAIQDSFQGIYAQTSEWLNIGGMNSADCNVISGHSGNGIQLKGKVTDCVIMGNFIGVDISGSKALGNQLNGIELLGNGFANSNTRNVIGGIALGESNVISCNGNAGIRLGYPKFAGVNENEIIGNYIGTDATGTQKLGNNYCGIEVYDNDNTIGGIPFHEKNIISGNLGEGVLIIEGASHNHIVGNYIGVDASGMHALGNDGNGIQIGEHGRHGFSNGNIVDSNVIAGNQLYGILILKTSTQNLVQNNILGKNFAASSYLPNRKGNIHTSEGNTLSDNIE